MRKIINNGKKRYRHRNKWNEKWLSQIYDYHTGLIVMLSAAHLQLGPHLTFNKLNDFQPLSLGEQSLQHPGAIGTTHVQYKCE